MTEPSERSPFRQVPPHLVRHGFLAEAECDALLEWAAARGETFGASMIRGSRTLNSGFRNSLDTRDLGEWKGVLRQRLGAILPEIFATLGVPAFPPSKIELQLAAYNHGHFYKPHVDLRTGPSDETSVRVLSAVYYFPAEPRQFSGGALRLLPLQQGGASADIEPERNSLVVFPSWVPHEVRPVDCPSERFEDSRFAINCWVRRAKPGAPAQ